MGADRSGQPYPGARPDEAGHAAALQGGLSFGLGGLSTPLAGLLGGSPTAMGAIMACGLGVAAILQTVAPRLLTTQSIGD